MITSVKKKDDLDLYSYRDPNTQQNFIGQHPISRRSSYQSSSKGFVLAWRSQVNTRCTTAKEKDQFPTTKTKGSFVSQQAFQRDAAFRLPLPRDFRSVSIDEPRLREKASMSFPHHLRSRSELTTVNLPRNSVVFPSMDLLMPCDRQPWWQSGSHPIEECTSLAKLDSSSECEQIPKKTKKSDCIPLNEGIENTPSSSSNSTLSTSEADLIAAETRTCSGGSYNTCPSPPSELDLSQSGSSPTLCLMEEPSKAIFKDSCQSPLAHLYDLSPSVNDFVEQSYSVEEEGTSLEINKQMSVDDTIDPESSDRQALNPSPSNFKYQPSLSVFLDELRSNNVKEATVIGDESFGSSSLDEEDDSVQICRAWRENIAVAGLGASLANAHLLERTEENTNPVHNHTNLVRRRASKISMKATDLDTIHEASFDSLCKDDSLEYIDLCAHLLKRAKEGKITKVNPRKVVGV